MKQRKSLFLVCLLVVLSMAACQKSDKEPNKPEVPSTPTLTELKKQSSEVNVFKWDNWIYFSFKQNKVVEVTTPKTDKGWDIAFHISDFKTNGGEAGSGQGAAAKTDLSELATVVKLEGLEWVTDKTGVGIKKNMKTPEDKTEPKNLCLSDAVIKYDISTMPPPIAASKNVWLIKDAEGKVVEFKVISCAWDGPSDKKTLPLKFEYAYLPEVK